MARRIILREDGPDNLRRGSFDVDALPTGIEDAQKKVVEYLDDLALQQEDGDVKVDLVQVGHGSNQVLCAFEYRHGEDPTDVATAIVDEAVRDGKDGAVGKVRYAVLAQGRRGRKTFVLTFPDIDSDLAEEPPNERGALAQTMRQNQDLHNMVRDLVEQSLRASRQIIQSQQGQITVMQKTAIDNLQMMGDLYTAQHERQVSLLKAERGEKRIDEVAGFLMVTGQTIANALSDKFFGKKAFPAAPTALEQQFYALLNTMSEEQARALMTGAPTQFRPEQAIGLFHLFESLDDMNKKARGQVSPEPSQVSHVSPNGVPQAPPQQASP